MKIFRSSLLLISIGIFASCRDDENPPDFVGESVGSYSYTVRIIRMDSGALSVINGDLTVARDEGTLSIVVDDVELFKSSRLESTSSGFWFDIEAATLMDDSGNLVNRTGNPITTKDGKTYHGQYHAEAKELLIRASYTYQDVQFAQFNFFAEVIATKK